MPKKGTKLSAAARKKISRSVRAALRAKGANASEMRKLAKARRQIVKAHKLDQKAWNEVSGE